MGLIVDPQTRARISDVNGRFFNPPYPVSACFDGAGLPEDRIQKVHINPLSSVRLVNDKPNLLRTTSQKGFPVATHMGSDKFMDRGTFSLEKFGRVFPMDGDKTINYRDKSRNVEIGDLTDLLSVIGGLDKERGVFQQLPSGYQTGSITAIPNAGGKKLVGGRHDVTNGILHTNIPAQFKGAQPRVEEMGKDVIDALNLDYGHCIFAFDPSDPDNFKIVDISTTLNPQDCALLRAYTDMMNHAFKTKHTKKR
jgi:hypothetical protein